MAERGVEDPRVRVDDRGRTLTSPLPEVQLKWSDFVWSLEKLRHKAYSKRTRERYVKEWRLQLTAEKKLE